VDTTVDMAGAIAAATTVGIAADMSEGIAAGTEAPVAAAGVGASRPALHRRHGNCRSWPMTDISRPCATVTDASSCRAS